MSAFIYEHNCKVTKLACCYLVKWQSQGAESLVNNSGPATISFYSKKGSFFLDSASFFWWKDGSGCRIPSMLSKSETLSYYNYNLFRGVWAGKKWSQKEQTRWEVTWEILCFSTELFHRRAVTCSYDNYKVVYFLFPHCVLWFEHEMFPIGSCVWTRGPHPVVLFEKVVGLRRWSLAGWRTSFEVLWPGLISCSRSSWLLM